jgi:hypothetical protein
MVVEAELQGHCRQRVAVHERRAARSQEALVLVREAFVEEAADDEADDGVTQELEALVVAVGRGRVLVVELCTNAWAMASGSRRTMPSRSPSSSTDG